MPDCQRDAVVGRVPVQGVCHGVGVCGDPNRLSEQLAKTSEDGLTRNADCPLNDARVSRGTGRAQFIVADGKPAGDTAGDGKGADEDRLFQVRIRRGS